MTLFDWLIVGHLLGDFLFQTKWMSTEKTARIIPLLVHSLVYTAAVTVVSLPAGGLSGPAVALIFFSHMLLDNRRLVDFWSVKITGTHKIPGLKVMLDQTVHIVFLALAAVLST